MTNCDKNDTTPNETISTTQQGSGMPITKRHTSVPAIVSLVSGSIGILAIIIINIIVAKYISLSSPSIYIGNWILNIPFYLLPIAGIIAIISGVKGIKQEGNNSHHGSRNISIAGLVSGVVTIAFFLFVCVLYFINYQREIC
jgi:hypothetical protein